MTTLIGLAKLKRVAGLVLGAAALALVLAVPAEAKHRHHHNNAGAAAAAGIIGLATGAILGSALSGPRYYGGPVYYDPPRYYYPYRSRTYVAPRYYRPPPVYRRPARVYYRPWTPEWIAYCARKYRSFNPRTGTYVTYSGRVRMCH